MVYYLKRKKLIMKKFINIIVLIITFSILMTCEGKASDIEDNIKSLIKWCETEGGLTENPDGDSSSDWYIFGASRYGYKADYKKYLKSLESFVKNNGLDNAKATDYQRIALIVRSCGGNPLSFAGMNLIENGVYGRNTDNPLDEQGINGLIFGLITLDSGGYDVPEDSIYNRKRIVEDIISSQLDDGGFALYGEEADADITAMAVQALAPYYLEDKGINVKKNVEMALDSLSKMQLDTGGYESGGIENSESCAQVVMALCSLGKNPYEDKSFIKNGVSVADALMGYKREDGGFSNTPEGQSDWMAGSQALNALVSIYRYENGMDRLYDIGADDYVKADDNNYFHNNYYGILIVFICIAAAGVIIYGKVRKAKSNK